MSPTERTLKALRADGWLADIVERRITRTLTKDMFGIADVIAVRGQEILAIQCTDRTNVSHRIRKIEQNENADAVRKAGIRIEVWGWGKMKSGRWGCRKVDVS